MTTRNESNRHVEIEKEKLSSQLTRLEQVAQEIAERVNQLESQADDFKPVGR